MRAIVRHHLPDGTAVGGLKLHTAPGLTASLRHELAPGDVVDVLTDAVIGSPAWSYVKVIKSAANIGDRGYCVRRFLEVAEPPRAKPLDVPPPVIEGKRKPFPWVDVLIFAGVVAGLAIGIWFLR